MAADFPTIWPSAHDPRVVVDPRERYAGLRRWARRGGTRAADLARYHAARAIGTCPTLLAFVLLFVGPALLPAAPAPGEPVQALANFLVYIAILIVSAIISIALAPKPPQPKPNALADFDAPTAEEGKPYSKVFGEALCEDPNVVWFGDLRVKAIKKKAGKK